MKATLPSSACRYLKAQVAYKVALTLTNVKPVAISAHIGSMITDPGYYQRAVDRYVTLTQNLKRSLGINIQEINIGGGFGVQSLNYYSLQNVILEKAGITKYKKVAPIDEFGRKIAGYFKSKIQEKKLGNIKLILEPGRFIASDAGVLLTKVVSVKDNWVFIDGGINLIPESIFFIRRGFVVDKKPITTHARKYNVAGPTLNTADVLASNQILPQLVIGDTVVVLDAGAYSLTRSTQFTILRPTALYVRKNKKIEVLREREKPSDFIGLMKY